MSGAERTGHMTPKLSTESSESMHACLHSVCFLLSGFFCPGFGATHMWVRLLTLVNIVKILTDQHDQRASPRLLPGDSNVFLPN